MHAWLTMHPNVTVSFSCIALSYTQHTHTARACTHTHTRMHARTHAHTHIHTHTHTHTQHARAHTHTPVYGYTSSGTPLLCVPWLHLILLYLFQNGVKALLRHVLFLPILHYRGKGGTQVLRGFPWWSHNIAVCAQVAELTRAWHTHTASPAVLMV